MTDHLKRLAAPKTWNIKRKEFKYITKANPGPHNETFSLPLNVIMRDLIGNATSNREVQVILNHQETLVDGIKRKDYRFPVGLFDVISFPQTKNYYRVLLSGKGKLFVSEITEAESRIKPLRVVNKSMTKGKIQITFNDGRNILLDKTDYRVGDGVIAKLGGKKLEIQTHMPLAKKTTIFLVGGSHIGSTGIVEDISGSKLLYKNDKGDVVETLKEYAFPIGKEKPEIKIQ